MKFCLFDSQSAKGLQGVEKERKSEIVLKRKVTVDSRRGSEMTPIKRINLDGRKEIIKIMSTQIFHFFFLTSFVGSRAFRILFALNGRKNVSWTQRCAV